MVDIVLYLFLSFQRRFRSLLLRVSHFSTRITDARVRLYVCSVLMGNILFYFFCSTLLSRFRFTCRWRLLILIFPESDIIIFFYFSFCFVTHINLFACHKNHVKKYLFGYFQFSLVDGPGKYDIWKMENENCTAADWNTEFDWLFVSYKKSRTNSISSFSKFIEYFFFTFCCYFIFERILSHNQLKSASNTRTPADMAAVR